jgi:hypothetical protein
MSRDPGRCPGLIVVALSARLGSGCPLFSPCLQRAFLAIALVSISQFLSSIFQSFHSYILICARLTHAFTSFLSIFQCFNLSISLFRRNIWVQTDISDDFLGGMKEMY